MSPQIKQRERLLKLTEAFNRLRPWRMEALTAEVNGKLEHRAEVSSKTIQRDLKILMELKAPLKLGGEGYVFEERWQLPVSPLDEEELLAMGVAVKASEAMLLPDLREMARHNAGVQALASASDGEAARQLERFIVHSRGEQALVAPQAVEVIYQAWRQRRRVEARYRNGKGEVSSRELEPQVLFLYNGSWYLLGRDLAETAERRDLFFSLARFEAATLREESIELDPELEARVRRGEVFEHSPVNGVVLRLEPKFSSFIRERRWFAGESWRRGADGLWRLELAQAPLHAVLCLIFRFKGELVAEAPTSLREVVRKSAAKMSRQHEDED